MELQKTQSLLQLRLRNNWDRSAKPGTCVVGVLLHQRMRYTRPGAGRLAPASSRSERGAGENASYTYNYYRATRSRKSI
jgi:hypothetical protein